MNKLQNIVTKKGFTVFAVIDHQAGANKVLMKLAPSKEIIFVELEDADIVIDVNQQLYPFLVLQAFGEQCLSC